MKKPSKNTFINYIILHKWKIILAVMIIGYIIIFSRLSLIRHWSLGTYYYDLGIMHQVVYNSSQGDFLEMTDPSSSNQILRYAIHFDPLMVILAPFYWLFPKAEVLLIGQTIFLAVGAIPLYLLAVQSMKGFKQLSEEVVGLFFAFLYLNYFPLQSTNIFDFHAVTLVTGLLLLAIYFAEIKKYRLSAAVLLLCLLGKENIGLLTCMVGLYYFFFKKAHAFGAFVSAVSILTVILVVGVLIPSQRTDLHFASSYISTNIMDNVHRLFSIDSYHYLVSLLQPVGFISLLSPLYLLISLPEWLINLLSKNANLRALQYHYTALITPFIFVSAVYGYRFLITRLSEVKKIQPNLKTIIIVLSLIILSFNLYTSHKNKVYERTDKIDTSKLEIVEKLADRLKDDTIPVSASGHLAPYFSGRKYFYNFLFDFAYPTMNTSDETIKERVTKYEKADYVIIQESEMDNENQLVRFYYQHIKNNPDFRLVFDKDEIEVYHRIGSPNISLDGI